MRNAILLTVLIAATAVVAMAAADYYDSPKAAKGTPGLLSVLRPGQTVTLSECGGNYELTVSNTKILSRYKVSKVGADYVVLSSQPKLLDIRIPVTSIRAIKHLKR
ncbi:MAG: hypothetical protein QGG42_01885 [Phycisphaerae bacterium]|jgi:hypothetical protein|nr:hypothetical protein [Phycisphaerae bacterium]